MKLYTIVIYCLLYYATGSNGQHSAPFHLNLYRELAQQYSKENIIFSPLSVQVLLAFIYTRSSGKLAQQLQNVLQLPSNRTRTAYNFENIFNALDNNNEVKLLMANGLFYNQKYGSLAVDTKHLALHSFGSEIKSLDFSQNLQAAEYINSWVAQKTQQLIKNTTTANSLNEATSAVLVNAIYFKGAWQNPFSMHNTAPNIFHTPEQKQISVDMMYTEDRFLYGRLKDLKASVLELPYRSSDISMMIILPTDRYGLDALETQLSGITLEEIRSQLKREDVQVKFPKFKFEFTNDMLKSLQQLGLTALFNEEAKIDLFERQSEPLIVDQFQHKAFIGINETGTEAAAGTLIKFIPLSLPADVYNFVADHPFMFIIHNTKAVLFMGHVVNP